MIKLLVLLLLSQIWVLGVSIDPKVLEDIIHINPHAQKEKVLLAKYYIGQNKDRKALVLLESVLKDHNNTDAFRLKEKIKNKVKNRALLKKIHLSYPIKSKDAELYLKKQYDKNQYKDYLLAYNALIESDVILRDIYHIHAANIHLWDGAYALSSEALKHIEDKNNLEKVKIQADICYYTGKYGCAVELFEKLYAITKDINTGIKLIYSYTYIGEIDKAKKLYRILFKQDPKNKALQKAGKTFSKQDNKRLKIAKEKYEEKHDYISLAEYCYLLYNLGYKEEALNVLHTHNEKYANTKSLLLEAQYLSWSAHNTKALKILDTLDLKGNEDAKLLMGKIFSWQNNFEKSKKYLNEIIESSKNKKRLYEAKKALAFVYKWEQKKQKSKVLFTKLHNENKDDEEVIEALMELNGDYKGLINRYKKRSSGGGGAKAKKLSELYFQDNQTDKAIESLKAYLVDNPNDLEATKNLALMLIDKKEYYTGFGNLEYYAAQKNDANSSLILAQNYYWHGFNEEAIDVLNKLLEKYPNNKKALELRAKILKVAPRMSKSNPASKVNDYFEQVGLKQLEIADALYFNGHHAASLMYYENYLSEEPTNHNVRLRYAFALENAGLYSKAEGEFYLMFWTNKTDEIKYHYGYNLMMNGKFDKATEVFNNLKDNTYRPIDPKLKVFLEDWKKAWESKDFSRYKMYYNKSMLDDDLWALSTQQAFNDATFISVGMYDLMSRPTDKPHRYKVKFYQEVANNHGSKKGYKTLDIVCSNYQSECQIVDENFEIAPYNKSTSLLPLVNQRLQDIRAFKKSPQILKKIKRKKKNLFLTM